MNNAGGQNIVQIFEEDGVHLITTVLGISAFRFEPADEATITLAERDPSGARPMKTWFYPGDQYGVEFVTPEPMGPQIARVSSEPARPVYSEPAPYSAPTSTGDEQGSETSNEGYASSGSSSAGDSLDDVDTAASSSSSSPTFNASDSSYETQTYDAQTNESSSIPSTQDADGELPQTASPLYLVGLVGLTSLGAGFLMRSRRQRRG
ncbi:MAG: LPXTG cell wall anchor domain-containing protein [Acidobacteria bacterium]|nr:LPXTG cell wall anchor domain-containing protein [Acidobacteriota bacterium]